MKNSYNPSFKLSIQKPGCKSARVVAYYFQELLTAPFQGCVKMPILSFSFEHYDVIVV